MSDIKALIENVNSLLHAGEPENISVDTFAGYTGYKPQSIIDAMNEVFEIGSWGFEEISNTLEGGEKGLAVAQVRVWLKGVDFQPTGWGQSNITRGAIGDAKKGAQTDAMKKAFSYFGIGKRAYLGLLEDPKKGNQGGNNQRPPQVRPQPVRQQPPQPMTKPTPAPTSTAAAPLPKDLRVRCTALKISWSSAKVKVLGSDVPDDNLTPEQCNSLHVALAKREEAA